MSQSTPTPNALDVLNERIVSCDRCPRLRAHCQAVGQNPPARYRDHDYWMRPVPTFADRTGKARLLIVGLAPAAHGANRTGRMFTGDRSGDFLFRALHETGFASQPDGRASDDGLELRDAAITAAAHCAPPQNKPTAEELANCQPFLDQTFDILADELRVIVCLGRLAHDQVLRRLQRQNAVRALRDYPFAHAGEHRIAGQPLILDSYHPSQQNTFTGRLTREMLRDVFRRAREQLT